MKEEQQIIADLYNWKSLVRPYATPENKLARKEIIKTFAPFLVLYVVALLAYEVSYWISLPICLVTGLFLTRIFIIQHDCGHQSFFPNRKLNNKIGFIASLFTWIPYRYWSRSHSYHHSHQGQLDTRTIGDVTLLTVNEYMNLSAWGKFRYKLYRSIPVMFILGPLYYIFIHNRIPFINFRNWKNERRTLLVTNLYLAAMFLVFGGILSLLHWNLFEGYKMLVLVYVPILASFGFTSVWFFYMQHQHDPNYKAWKEDWQYVIAAIRGSSFYKLPGISNFFTGNIGYHHIHHLAPSIPFYKLPQCSRENPILQKHVTIITFFSSMKYAFYTLWDEQNSKMVRFADLKKLKRTMEQNPLEPIKTALKQLDETPIEVL